MIRFIMDTRADTIMAMAGIERIHWGRVGPGRLDGEPGWFFALWPAPVNHDLCFQDAGFTHFADQDDQWDVDLAAVLETMVVTLSEHGEPVITAEELFEPRQSFLDRLLRKPRRRLALGIAERFALPMRDDNHAPCRLAFGSPVRAAACASDGHEIIWLWLHDSEAGQWPAYLHLLACGHPVTETNLTWQILFPECWKSAETS